MKKKMTAICCAALLAPALYAQRPEHAALIAQEARGNANAAFRCPEENRSGCYNRTHDRYLLYPND